MENKNILCSWSGGKDSCFALMQVLKERSHSAVLLNVLNEEGKISRSHGIPADVLQKQAALANIPIHLIAAGWQNYEVVFTSALSLLKEKYLITHAVFGDIDLQAHRDWEEKVCHTAGLKALLPLWQINRKTLVLEMLNEGIQTVIVSCNDVLGPDFLGRVIDLQCIIDLEEAGVDVCGENGEFHTLVLDCPLFSSPLAVMVTEKLKHENYWFSQLTLQ